MALLNDVLIFFTVGDCTWDAWNTSKCQFLLNLIRILCMQFYGQHLDTNAQKSVYKTFHILTIVTRGPFFFWESLPKLYGMKPRYTCPTREQGTHSMLPSHCQIYKTEKQIKHIFKQNNQYRHLSKNGLKTDQYV